MKGEQRLLQGMGDADWTGWRRLATSPLQGQVSFAHPQRDVMRRFWPRVPLTATETLRDQVLTLKMDVKANE